MSKAKQIFIGIGKKAFNSSMDEKDIAKEMSKDPADWAIINDSMKAYALAFAQSFYKDISHVEIVMSDVEQFDKEI